jgi:hypothetical protein
VLLRLALASLLLAAVLTTGSTAAATPDSTEQVRALDRLLRAAGANDEPAMWAALSQASRRRLGPTLADFRRRGARGVHDEIAPFARGHYRVILDAIVDRGLGVVAIAGGREHTALAVPVRRERGVWKAEIDPAFTVEAVRPVPGERVLRRTQVFAEVSAPGRIDGAVMWFDGRFFEARGYWSPNKKRMSMWGEAPQPLANGRHTVVAFATAGPEAAANAWVFTARGRGSGSR